MTAPTGMDASYVVALVKVFPLMEGGGPSWMATHGRFTLKTGRSHAVSPWSVATMVARACVSVVVPPPPPAIPPGPLPCMRRDRRRLELSEAKMCVPAGHETSQSARLPGPM
eukprot:2258954-Pleurochrysis_carterae.AAC.3